MTPVRTPSHSGDSLLTPRASLTGSLGAPIRPGDIRTRWATVEGGACLSGERADAVVDLEPAEHDRRQREGLGAATDLTLLKVCMGLPLDTAVRLADLPQPDQALIDRAPAGLFEVHSGLVSRRITSVMAVHAVTLTGNSWATLLGRAAAFSGVAQRVVVMTSAPANHSERLWEAQLQGVGVWLRDGDDLVELLAPEVFVPRLIKPARWRFFERAYATWLRQGGRSASCGVVGGHQVRPAAAESDRLQGLLPLG